MTLEEEFEDLSGGEYNFQNLVFQLQGVINTLQKLHVGFEVKELSEDRKSDIIETLEFLVWYFDFWCSNSEEFYGI